MFTQKLRYIDALKLVRKQRPIVLPNPGFIKQLIHFEKFLFQIQHDKDKLKDYNVAISNITSKKKVHTKMEIIKDVYIYFKEYCATLKKDEAFFSKYIYEMSKYDDIWGFILNEIMVNFNRKQIQIVMEYIPELIQKKIIIQGNDINLMESIETSILDAPYYIEYLSILISNLMKHNIINHHRISSIIKDYLNSKSMNKKYVKYCDTFTKHLISNLNEMGCIDESNLVSKLKFNYPC